MIGGVNVNRAQNIIDVDRILNLSNYNKKIFKVPEDGIINVEAQWQPTSYAYVMIKDTKFRYASVSSPVGVNNYSQTNTSVPVYKDMELYLEIGPNGKIIYIPFK